MQYTVSIKKVIEKYQPCLMKWKWGKVTSFEGIGTGFMEKIVFEMGLEEWVWLEPVEGDALCRKSVMSRRTKVAFSSIISLTLSSATQRSSPCRNSFYPSPHLYGFRLHLSPSTVKCFWSYLCLPGFITEPSFLQHSLKLPTYMDGLPDFSHWQLRDDLAQITFLVAHQLPVDKITRNTSSFLGPSLPSLWNRHLTAHHTLD